MKKLFNKVRSIGFIFIKNKGARAKFVTLISKFQTSFKNKIEYDPHTGLYIHLGGSRCLLISDYPTANYSWELGKKRFQAIFSKFYTPKSGDIIVDIGAGIGEEMPYYMEHITSMGMLYSIEASPSSFIILQNMTKKNNYDNVSLHNVAIAEKNGILWMDEGSQYKANQINYKKSGMEITCLTLDSFVDRNGLKIIDLLKMNIEGAEIQVIKGMEKTVLITQNIAISCHDFLFEEETNIRKTVTEYFKAHNFEIYENNTGNKYIDSWIYGTRKF